VLEKVQLLEDGIEYVTTQIYQKQRELIRLQEAGKAKNRNVIKAKQ
jgi:hypothetical protein